MQQSIFFRGLSVLRLHRCKPKDFKGTVGVSYAEHNSFENSVEPLRLLYDNRMRIYSLRSDNHPVRVRWSDADLTETEYTLIANQDYTIVEGEEPDAS